jgi:hypothetical protein
MIDLPELIDASTGTVTTCADIARLDAVLESGKRLTHADGKQLLQDLANLRYRFAVDRVQHQVMEILSRSWEGAEEAVADLVAARKLLRWVCKEHQEMRE